MSTNNILPYAHFLSIQNDEDSAPSSPNSTVCTSGTSSPPEPTKRQCWSSSSGSSFRQNSTASSNASSNTSINNTTTDDSTCALIKGGAAIREPHNFPAHPLLGAGSGAFVNRGRRPAGEGALLELSFEYLFVPEGLRWVKVLSPQSVLLSLCLQSMVQQLVSTDNGGDRFAPPRAAPVSDSAINYTRKNGSTVLMYTHTTKQPKVWHHILIIIIKYSTLS